MQFLTLPQLTEDKLGLLYDKVIYKAVLVHQSVCAQVSGVSIKKDCWNIYFDVFMKTSKNILHILGVDTQICLF